MAADARGALRSTQSVGAVAIFVKTPGLSPVKTRLAADIGVEAAEEFHRLSARAVQSVATEAIFTTGWSAYWAVAEPEALAHSDWSSLSTLWQGDGALGDRLARINSELHKAHRCVMLLGADAPQLTADLLCEAMDAVAGSCGSHDPRAISRFAIGPAADGGFYLFAGSTPLPATVWKGVQYSCPSTGDELARRVRDYGDVARLPVRTDVDTADDLPRLCNDLHTLPHLTSEQAALLRFLESTLPVA